MSDQSEQPNPFRSRRFVLSMVVVAFIALLAVIVLVSNLAGGKKQAAPASTATASSPTTPIDSDPSTCGLKGYETSGTVDSAPKTKWQLVGTVAAPTDRSTVGPGTIEPNGFRNCFAHTPTGALYAAVNMMAITSDKSLTREFATKLVVPGAGQKALLAQAGSSSSVASRYQIAGFKIDSYKNSSATVDLAVNFSTGQMLSFPIQLQWLNGDWKLKTTNDGGFTLSPAQLQSLGGYIPWAGA